MGIGVIVDIKLKPEGVEPWTTAIEARLPTARLWKGCEQVYLGVNQQDPNHLTIVQRWSKMEDYANYREWALARPGTKEIQAYLVNEVQTTYLDDTRGSKNNK